MSTPQYKKKTTKKAIYRQNRQRQYVGNLVMDNMRLHIEMVISGFPVKSTQAEAVSGKSQLWEEEKQAYLNCEKISLVDAVNHLGSDFVLDLCTSTIIQETCPEAEEITVNLPETYNEIKAIDISHPVQIGAVSNWECDLLIKTTDVVPVHRGLNSKETSTIVHPVRSLENVVCDYTSAGHEDSVTTAVVIDDTIAGVLKDYVEPISFKCSKCIKLCEIPTNVLNVLVREDKTIAEKCYVARDVLRCNHLKNVQLPSRPELTPDYGRHTLVMGKTNCSRGWKYEDYFPWMLYPRGKKEAPYPPEDYKSGCPLSTATMTFLRNLRYKDVALRTLHHLARLTEDGVGRRTRYLWQYSYDPGATPKHEVFPMRGAR